MRVELVCPTCEGKGYEVEEHIRVVAEHDPSCSGGPRCSETCPVPMPYPEYERVPCSSCGATVSGFSPEAVQAVTDGLVAHDFSGDRMGDVRLVVWDDRLVNSQGGHYREASPTEILAAAATLDGAEVIDRGDGFIRWKSGNPPPPGRYLVNPLPDKETTNE